MTATPQRIRVVHRVGYRFAEPIRSAQISVMLRPRDLEHQRTVHHQLLVEPAAADDNTEFDAFGNHRQRVHVAEEARELTVTAVSLVTWSPPATPSQHAEARRWLDDVDAASAAGRCQQRATWIVDRLRSRGIAARYVAGYAVPRRRSRMLPHAWLAVETADGWLDFDPTSQQFSPPYLTVAWGDGYDDVAPLSGALGIGANARFRQQSSVIIEPKSSTSSSFHQHEASALRDQP